ncbi:MAG: hypothetical protein AAB819_00490 [Patescibacteria group bacterium]
MKRLFIFAALVGLGTLGLGMLMPVLVFIGVGVGVFLMYPMFGLAERWMFTAGIAISIAITAVLVLGTANGYAVAGLIGSIALTGIGAYGMMERRKELRDRFREIAELPETAE